MSNEKVEELLLKNQKLEGEVKTFQEEAAQADEAAKKAEEDKTKAEAEAKESKERADKAEGEAAKAAEEKKNAQIDTEIKEYVDKEDITPHQGEILKELFKKGSMEPVTINKKEFKTVGELMKAYIAADVDLQTDEKSEAGEKGKDLATKAKEYSEKHKVSIREATIAVSE